MPTNPYTVPLSLEQYIGDSRIHEIPMTWNGQPFNPVGWGLVFTAKAKTSATDLEAKFQKASGLGIAVALVAGVWTAFVEVVPADTVEISPSVLRWDIQAQNTTSGAVRTIAFGLLTLERDVTRAYMTSIPIHTSQPPAPTYVSGGLGDPYVVSVATENLGSSTFVAGAAGGVSAAYGPSRPAIGFVKAATMLGQSAQVFPGGELNGLSGLTVGATYYLGTTPGSITATPPTVGLFQSVGTAMTADTLLVEISDPIHLV